MTAVQPPDERPRLTGSISGNLFRVVSASAAALDELALNKEASELRMRAMAAPNYDDALAVVKEYVNIDDVELT